MADETLFTDILTRLRPGYKDAGIVTKQKRITAAEAIKKLISEDKPISFKNIADKTGVPKTTIARVYNEQFKNKGTLAKSGNAKKITQEIIDSGITDVNKIKQIAKQKYNIQLANRSVQQAVNIATDLSVGEYENMFKKMATDRTYKPPVDISAKGKGLSANYIKAKANPSTSKINNSKLN